MPKLGDFLEIHGWNIDVGSGRVLAHLLGIARAGDNDANRGVSNAKSDGRLAEIFYRSVNEEFQLICFS